MKKIKNLKHNKFFRQFVLNILVSFLIIFMVLSFDGCSRQEAPKIKVGLGEAVITPQMDNVPMRGYAARNSTGVHDDLYARSLVIEGEDGTTAVFLTLALCNMNLQYYEQIRSEINQKTKIPVENIIISCTHTHSGPYVRSAPEEYRKYLVDRSVASVVDAWNNRIPGRIGFDSTQVMGLGMNDRRMLHGGMHPDPEAAIIKIENEKGKLIGVAFNFGCHPSTLDLHNLQFTEDWPYYSIKGLKEALGEDIWIAYYQSAQGDVKVGYTAELSAVGAYMYGLRTFEYAEYKGGLMIDPVLKALDTITTSGDPEIKVSQHTIDLPRRKTSPVTLKEAIKIQKDANEKLAEMEKIADRIGKRVLDSYRVDVFLADRLVSGARRVEQNPNPEPLTDVWQQAVRIGDTVFVTFPNEVFTEIGKAVKDQSPYEKTYVIGLASGYSGYIPTKAEYLEGGYAVDGNGFGEECEQVIIDSSRKIIAHVTE